jgi:hypothetical protein
MKSADEKSATTFKSARNTEAAIYFRRKGPSNDNRIQIEKLKLIYINKLGGIFDTRNC